jgi:F0F1-type ATP synthase membrane subunit c/vacuolar-type H+-ATPase subunit K
MDAVQREDAESEVVGDEYRNFGFAHWGALILLAAAAASAPFHFVYAVAAVAWLVLRRARTSFREAFVIAIVLRAMFLFTQPQLSGDVYRYLWDGNELAHGRNPYARAPAGEPRINHPEIPTIYPPHAEILFAIAHSLPLWRLLLIACDLVTLWLLPRRFALAYATFPPLLFEGAWSAHVEVVAAMLLLLALQRRSGAALGAAIGVKIIPIAALPVLAKSPRFLVVCLLVLVIPAIPFMIAGPIMPGMHDYATRWIFNSPAYDLVLAIVDHVPLKAWWTAIKDPLHLESISDWVYRHAYADFVTRALLGLIAVVFIVRSRRVSSAIASLLLCSPAIHPWYWIVAVPSAMVERANFVVALALCAPFSYLLYAGASKWVVYALCYALPIGALSPGAGERDLVGRVARGFPFWRRPTTQAPRSRSG